MSEEIPKMNCFCCSKLFSIENLTVEETVNHAYCSNCAKLIPFFLWRDFFKHPSWVPLVDYLKKLDKEVSIENNSETIDQDSSTSSKIKTDNNNDDEISIK